MRRTAKNCHLRTLALGLLMVLASTLQGQSGLASTSDWQQPTSAAPAQQQATPPKAKGMVWVNTESGFYHKPGTRWYGKTRQGKYMLEADAIKAGYKLAK